METEHNGYVYVIGLQDEYTQWYLGDNTLTKSLAQAKQFKTLMCARDELLVDETIHEVSVCMVVERQVA